MKNLNKDLSEKCLSLFIAYAQDAGNWDGLPVIGGNINSTLENNGYLGDLVKKGYIETEWFESGQFIRFTNKGKELAEENGISSKYFG
jgi:hypothetical protein